MSERNVLMIYTGGTIGMVKGSRGYEPAPGQFMKMLQRLPSFQDPDQPPGVTPVSRHGRRIHYAMVEYEPLLDSSNMGMEDWVRIARDIERYYDDYDAFLVLHGTDTMAYTASALSFMLENLNKTVIVTGSQIPLSEVRNDGDDNLLDALLIAGHYDIPEVGLYFRSRLFRGNRTRKVDASGLEAFGSENAPPLATVGIHIDVAWDQILSPTGDDFRVTPITNPNVATLRLFPGITRSVLDNFLRPPLAGLVLETYGAGNAPDNRTDFLDALRDASDRGVVIVNATQCYRGEVVTAYAAGTALAEAGVVPGGDMTAEAALTKLAFLLSQDIEPDEVRRLMPQSLRGELSTVTHQGRFSFKEKAFVNTVAKALSVRTPGERDQIEQALYPVLLCSAAALGDLSGVRRMCEGGAEPGTADYDGRTALHLAAAEGHVEVVAYLLSRGAPPSARDRWGATPLHDAVQNGHERAADLLLKHGAKGEADPAMLCTLAGNGDTERLKRWLRYGADPSIGDYDRRTPLHLAAAEGHLDTVRVLLEHGADESAQDRWGTTPAQGAHASGHDAVHALLLDK